MSAERCRGVLDVLRWQALATSAKVRWQIVIRQNDMVLDVPDYVIEPFQPMGRLHAFRLRRGGAGPVEHGATPVYSSCQQEELERTFSLAADRYALSRLGAAASCSYCEIACGVTRGFRCAAPRLSRGRASLPDAASG